MGKQDKNTADRLKSVLFGCTSFDIHRKMAELGLQNYSLTEVQTMLQSGYTAGSVLALSIDDANKFESIKDITKEFNNNTLELDWSNMTMYFFEDIKGN